MQSLTFEYPLWYLAVCALAGLGVSLLLYYRAALSAPRWLVGVMAALRFVAFTAVAILLLSPLLRFLQTDRQEPIVVLAQDVSESVGLEIDSAAYTVAWAELRDRLAEDHRVVEYRFGSTVRTAGDTLGYGDKQSDIDALLREVADRYGNQNLGAVVLASDGIYNQGANPTYRDYSLPAPVYTVGLGDTTRRRDLLVSRVFHNRIAYLDDRFAIEIDLTARNAAGERSTLTVSEVTAGGNNVLHREAVVVEGDDYFTTREVTLAADRPGVRRYRVSLTAVGQEVSTVNNSRDIYVEVLDARQKILLLAAAPHPDLSALRQSLSGNRNKEVEIAYANRFAGRVADYDLVVLHQLPSPVQRIGPVLAEIERAGIARLFVTGPSLPAAYLNGVQELVEVRGAGAQVQGNEVTAGLVTTFSAFTVGEQLARALPTFPPLTAPFGNFSVRPGAEVLLQQRIGRVDTDYPLLVVGRAGESRTGVLLAAGIWRWRLFDYLENGDHARFDELVSQLTQYLTVREDKRRFRVTAAGNLFDENEAVRLDGELYNESYEPINEPEASAVITGPEGQEYDYTFTRTARAYTLSAGTLPPGNYRYRASVTESGEALVAEGRFTVQAIELERYALEADHALLRRLSERYGGELVFADQLGELPGRIAASGLAKPVLYESVTARSVVNLQWLFFGLLALLVGEWGLRRWSGNY